MSLLKDKALSRPWGKKGSSGTQGGTQWSCSWRTCCPHSLPTHGSCFPTLFPWADPGIALLAVDIHPTAGTSWNPSQRWSTCLSTSPNFNYVLTPFHPAHNFPCSQTCGRCLLLQPKLLHYQRIFNSHFNHLGNNTPLFLFSLKDVQDIWNIRCYINLAWKTLRIWRNAKTNHSSRDTTI